MSLNEITKTFAGKFKRSSEEMWIPAYEFLFKFWVFWQDIENNLEQLLIYVKLSLYFLFMCVCVFL